jgi:hypothetical protein
MNIAEAELLDRSMGRLSDTLLRNRMMSEDKRRYETGLGLQRDDIASRMGLQRDELTARMADREDARENRRLVLEGQAAHQKRIEEIQKEGNESKRNQMYLEFLGDLNKTGQLTDEGLGVMEQKFNEQFGQAGLGVKLFRRAAPTEPTVKDLGGGVRSVFMPGSKDQTVIDDRATVTEDPGDGLTGPTRKVTRRVAPEAVGPVTAPGLAGPPESGDPLADAMRAGKTAPLKKEMDEHLNAVRGGDEDYGLLNLKSRPERIRELQRRMAELEDPTGFVPPAAAGATERVTVVAPDGKRGTIPKAQLQQALKEGYKLAQ